MTQLGRGEKGGLQKQSDLGFKCTETTEVCKHGLVIIFYIRVMFNAIAWVLSPAVMK